LLALGSNIAYRERVISAVFADCLERICLLCQWLFFDYRKMVLFSNKVDFQKKINEASRNLEIKMEFGEASRATVSLIRMPFINVALVKM
jgi:hypothetical protein